MQCTTRDEVFHMKQLDAAKTWYFTPLISLGDKYIPTLVTSNFILAIEYVRMYLLLALCS